MSAYGLTCIKFFMMKHYLNAELMLDMELDGVLMGRLGDF